MKAPRSKSANDKKASVSASVGLSAAPPEGIAVPKPSTGYGSPSGAVWSRYIDSRMKQFGTR